MRRSYLIYTDPLTRARDGYAPDAKCLWWHSRSGCCLDRAVTFFHIPPLMRCPAFITDPYLRARDGYAPDAKCLWWHSRSGCCPDRARQRIPDKKGRRICGSPTNYTFSPLSAAALAAALDSKYSA